MNRIKELIIINFLKNIIIILIIIFILILYNIKKSYIKLANTKLKVFINKLFKNKILFTFLIITIKMHIIIEIYFLISIILLLLFRNVKAFFIT